MVQKFSCMGAGIETVIEPCIVGSFIGRPVEEVFLVFSATRHRGPISRRVPKRRLHPEIAAKYAAACNCIGSSGSDLVDF